jgi:hypothetical protein
MVVEQFALQGLVEPFHLAGGRWLRGLVRRWVMPFSRQIRSNIATPPPRLNRAVNCLPLSVHMAWDVSARRVRDDFEGPMSGSSERDESRRGDEPTRSSLYRSDRLVIEEDERWNPRIPDGMCSRSRIRSTSG